MRRRRHRVTRASSFCSGFNLNGDSINFTANTHMKVFATYTERNLEIVIVSKVDVEYVRLSMQSKLNVPYKVCGMNL